MIRKKIADIKCPWTEQDDELLKLRIDLTLNQRTCMLVVGLWIGLQIDWITDWCRLKALLTLGRAVGPLPEA